MFIKLKAALLATLALCMVSGAAASTASAAGPYWHVGGSRLEKGIRQVKLQVKGFAVLKVPAISLTVTCKNAISEGATIEGNGLNQGQDKGRLAFTQCITSIVGCNVAEPVVTNPIQSFLANAATQTHIVDVFQEAQGPLAVVTLVGAPCGAFAGPNEVTGSLAAEIVPTGVEVQELLLAFPEPAITKIKHEGIERTVGLKFSALTATFSAAFGARLATFPEKFGAFET